MIEKDNIYDTKKTRSYCVLLYTDNVEHMRVLKELQVYNCAYIIHNKDVDLNNEIKKEHIHVVVEFNNARYREAIAKEFRIDKTVFEPCKNKIGALRYLIHLDDENKYQYNVDDVKGSLSVKLKENILKGVKTEGMRVCDLIEYIDNKKDYIDINDFSKYCAENGYWDVFRRSSVIFIRIIESHNDKYFHENYTKEKCYKNKN